MNNLFEYRDCFSEYKDVKSHLIIGKKREQKPDISILMPVFSHHEYFEKALLSAINQDFTGEYEIVVVDNNPLTEEKTEYQEIIERLNPTNIMYYRNECNIGLFGNWNRCVELADGQFVTFLHDDDLLLPCCLSELMRFPPMYGNKAVFSQQNTIDNKGEIIESSKGAPKKFAVLHLKEYYSINLLDNYVCNRGCGVGCLYNRQSIIDLGGYNKEYDPSSDYALNIRYVEKYGALETSEVLINYRRAVNYSYDCYNRWPGMDKFLRESILKKKGIYNFITKRVTNAFYRRQWVGVNLQFGDKSLKSVKEKPTWLDMRIYKFIVRCSILKHYKIRIGL